MIGLYYAFYNFARVDQTLKDDARRRGQRGGSRLDAYRVGRVARSGWRSGRRARIQTDPLPKIAERHGSKVFALRTARSLARWLCDRGRQAEARAILEPQHVSFTEGLDTPEVREATALLVELDQRTP